MTTVLTADSQSRKLSAEVDSPKTGVNAGDGSPLRLDPLKLLLFPARAFLALGWIRAGVEKVISPGWWTGSEVREFLDAQQDHMLPILEPFVARLHSTSVVVSLVVLIAELAIGLCLLTGRRLRPALLAACALNVAFVAFGAVTPSAFYLVLQLTLLGAVALSRTVPAWRAWLTVGLSISAALLLLPMIGTLHPAEVIEDPAIMLATLAMLVASTKTLALVSARVDR